jgi:hypothetical protein
MDEDIVLNSDNHTDPFDNSYTISFSGEDPAVDTIFDTQNQNPIEAEVPDTTKIKPEENLEEQHTNQKSSEVSPNYDESSIESSLKNDTSTQELVSDLQEEYKPTEEVPPVILSESIRITAPFHKDILAPIIQKTIDMNVELKITPSATVPEDIGTSTVSKKPFYKMFWDQLSVMMKRNTILQYRYLSSTLAQTLFAPLIFNLILYILQQADYNLQKVSNPHPPMGALDGLQPCTVGISNCVFMMYYPQSSLATQIMSQFATGNSARVGQLFSVATSNLTSLTYAPSSSDSTVIYPVASSDYIYNFAIASPNVTRWAVTFDILQPPAYNYTNVRYQVWFNATLTANRSDAFGRELTSMIRGIDESISK